MQKQRGSGRWGSGFTLVELLVVIAIIGVLVALLVPSLAKARRQALVLKCAANIRQVTYAMITYSHDNRGHFPESSGGGSPVNYMNRLLRAVQLRDEYVSGDSKVFHCPVAQPMYSTPTWKEATQTRFAEHEQIGYIYLGGWGSADTRSNWLYYGWYAQVASFNQGKRLTPTYSRTEADQAGNAFERPLVMDISMSSGNLYLGSAGAGLSYRSYANPAHGEYLGALDTPDQNVGYVDGHGETHGQPFRTKPLRTNPDIGLHF